MFLCHGAPQRHRHIVIEVLGFFSAQEVFSILNISLMITPLHSLMENLSLYKQNYQRIVLINWFSKHFHILRCLYLFEKGAVLNLFYKFENPLQICFQPQNSSKIKIHPQGNLQFFHLQWSITLFNVFENNFCFS